MGGGKDAGKGTWSKGKGKGAVGYDDWMCGDCGYNNFSRRAICRECGTKRNKGSGKGGNGGGGGSSSGGGAGAWGVGGIAQRQLRQQAEAEKIGKLRAEHKRELDRLQRQLDATKKGIQAPLEVDIDDDGDGDDLDEEEKEQRMQAELRQIESLAKSLDDASSFKEVARKKADELRKDIEDMRERKGGPEAKVLGKAGRHAKALRNARTKLVRRTKALAKAEEEAEAMEKELEELQERIKDKRKGVNEIKEEVQMAHNELEKLTKSEQPEDGAEEEGSAEDNPPLGPQARAQHLLEQLSSYVQGPYKLQLQELMQKAMAENLQRASDEWCGKADSGKNEAGKPPEAHKKVDEEAPNQGSAKGDGAGAAAEWEEDMDDIAASTIEQLELFRQVLEATPETGIEGTTADSEKAKQLVAIRARGGSSSKLAKVIKAHTDKQRDRERRGKPKPPAVTGSKKEVDETA